MSGTEASAATPDSPAVRAAKDQLELKRLRLERRRLDLEDQVSRLEATAKNAKGSVDAVKAYLPSTLDTPMEKDALTSQGDATGLAAVYAGRASAHSIDDIADRVVSATHAMTTPRVLVVADGSFVADQQQAAQMEVRLGLLEDALSDVGLTRSDEDQPVDSRALHEILSTRQGQHSFALAFAPVAGALASLVPSAVTSLTRLFSHQYTVSGTTIATPDLGVDLRLAGAVRAKMSNDPSAEVLIGRLWTPPGSTLLRRLVLLADRMREVKDRAMDADADRDVLAASILRTQDALVAAREQRKELVSNAPTGEPAEDGARDSGWKVAWDEVAKDLKSLGDELAELQSTCAAKDLEAERLIALVTRIEDFVVEVLTVSDDGTAPLVAATRGEWLQGSDERLVVYARVLSAGLDQVLDVKLGPDKRCVLSGASVEYAALGRGGRVYFAGVHDGLWTASMELTKPKTFQCQPVGYVPVANVTRPPKTASG